MQAPSEWLWGEGHSRGDSTAWARGRHSKFLLNEQGLHSPHLFCPSPDTEHIRYQTK